MLPMVTPFWRDTAFFSTMLRLALPIAAQRMLMAGLSLIDVVMIGQLGDASIAAVGIADQVFFLVMLFLFGVTSGSSIFTAQYWGQRDVVRIRRVLGLCMRLGVGGALIFTSLALFVPESVMGIYSTDPAVIEIGAGYLRWVGVSYVAMAITFSYAAILRSVENVKLPLLVSVIAISLNTFFNYALIFGHFGFPALGVDGAAMATCGARILEAGLLLFFVYRQHLPAAAGWGELFHHGSISLSGYFRTVVPVVLTEIAWSFGITTYNIVYARVGTESIAAMNIATSVERLLFVVFIGLGNACAIMLGNRIGAGEGMLAQQFARRFLGVGLAIALVLGTTMIAARPLVLSLYQASSITLTYASLVMLIMGLLLPVRVTNLLLLVGILRSGGDTNFAFWVDAGSVWGIGVPLALLGGFVWGLPVHAIYLLVMMEEVAKLGVGFWRMHSARWIHNLTVPA